MPKRKAPSGGGSGDEPPTPRRVEYSDMPPSHKRKFILNGDMGSYDKYVGMIEWISTLCTLDGSDFSDLKNIHCHPRSYPLLEAEIVYIRKSIKILIAKKNLYVVGGIVKKNKFQFTKLGTGFEISGFEELEGRDGKYTNEPWRSVGPASIVTAIREVNSRKVTPEVYANNLEKFAYHLSEAVRLIPVRTMIANMLKDTGGQATLTYEQETSLTAQEAFVPQEDIMDYVQVGGIDVGKSMETPPRIKKLVNEFKILCKIWFMFSLSDEKLFILEKKVAEECNIGSCKSLRSILGVLNNNNLAKLPPEMSKKAKKLNLPYTVDDHKQVLAKISKLKDDEKAFVYP